MLMIEKEQLCSPLSMEGDDRALFVWCQPVEGDKYFITVDVARGDSNDSATAAVWNYQLQQVAEYCAKVPPDKLAAVADALGRRYYEAVVVVENNSYGLMCLAELRKLKYPAIFYSKKNSDEFDIVNGQFGPLSEDLVAGLNTSSKTRPQMITLLERAIRNREMIIRSRRVKAELDTFIWNDGRPEAMRGCNDDLVITCALAALVYERMVKGRFRVDDEDIKALLNATTKTETLNTQIPGACKDPRLVPARTMGRFGAPVDPYSYKVGNATIDLSELLEPKVG
jgi:hypothetical protein